MRYKRYLMKWRLPGTLLSVLVVLSLVKQGEGIVFPARKPGKRKRTKKNKKDDRTVSSLSPPFNGRRRPDFRR